MKQIFYSKGEALNFISDNKITIRKLYITENRTAKEVALMLNIFFNQFWVKALNEELPKSSHGGARQGAGNKKGWNSKE